MCLCYQSPNIYNLSVGDLDSTHKSIHKDSYLIYICKALIIIFIRQSKTEFYGLSYPHLSWEVDRDYRLYWRDTEETKRHMVITSNDLPSMVGGKKKPSIALGHRTTKWVSPIREVFYVKNNLIVKIETALVKTPLLWFLYPFQQLLTKVKRK